MKKDKIQLVPIIKAVEEFGVNRQTISNWHDAGLLQGTVIKGNRFVTRESLDELKAVYPEAAADANKVDAYRTEIESLQKELKGTRDTLRKEHIYRHYAPRFVHNMIDKFVYLIKKMNPLDEQTELEAEFIRCWIFGHDIKEFCEKNKMSNYQFDTHTKQYRKLLYKMGDYAEMAEKYRLMEAELNETKFQLHRLQTDMDEYRSRNTAVNNEEGWKETYPILTKDLNDLDLTVKTLNILKMHGFKNLGQVIKLSRKELLKLRHFGMKCLVEIEDILEPYGLQVGMDISSIPLQETKD